jgi:formylglycine-generating enzyme required for sulfatase activity
MLHPSVAVCASFAALTLFTAVQASDTGDRQLTLIPGGQFETVLPPAEGVKTVKVNAFKLDRAPVTNEQYAVFLQSNPQWRRGQVAAIFADKNYLSHWSSALQPPAGSARQPVVRVSWFAASAYCEARGMRLPTWYEWEYVAAASETKRDARNEPEWRQRILDWYSKSARGALPDVAKGSANVYGVHDMHGVVWEWIEDLSGMLVSGDNRQQSDPDITRYCGTGAISMEQKEHYATLMRVAMLSSMQASYTAGSMGFRCATEAAQ